jgi:histidine ammonia-lyase
VAAEARLLAHPVTLEQPTSGIAAGIEDRITMFIPVLCPNAA